LGLPIAQAIGKLAILQSKMAWYKEKGKLVSFKKDHGHPIILIDHSYQTILFHPSIGHAEK